ncbi:NYN domain-containing protein [Paenibacillus sp. Y412MC10]|uniref:NYN domain-containing protein n=1 Tax=Geobacillus sp. (strain Y412MC10) TaxID=481743 RepID=UPI0011AB5F6A|nr:NYN domain-containing protein [Paenibacillus sp. Y412MC10]
MITAAVLVDEINAMGQLHDMGIEGIRPWRAFYDRLTQILELEYGKIDISFHFYGAIPPKERDERAHKNRTNFFRALERDGINVHRGMCLPSGNIWQEKGVDVMIALDLVEKARQNTDIIFLLSGDCDLIPAMERARRSCKVVSIISEKQPARLVKENSDGVVTLESIVGLIEKEHIVARKNAS